MRTKLMQILSGVILGMSLTTASLVRADDTDIYINSTSATASQPMVMFSLDWRPNLASTICNNLPTSPALDPANPTDQQTVATHCGWPDPSFVANFSAVDLSDGVVNYFELLRAVLKQVLGTLDSVKVGIMMNHNNNCTGNPTSGPTLTGCSNGGYILSGLNSIYTGDTNGNKAAFNAKLAKIPLPQGNASHSYQGKELFFELFRYLTGQGIYNGHLGWKDYGNTGASNNLNGTPSLESPDNSAIAWDTSIENGANYITPLANAAACTKIFTINIMFQVSNQESDSDSAISASKASGGMNGLVLSGNSNTFNSVLNWLYNNDLADGTYGTCPNINGKQNVTSYFLVSSPNTTTNGYATAGGTGAAITLGSDPTTMANAIRNIFNQILSVSTTFVSASVPVNVFNRTDYLNDVYIALFQAEKNGKPQWVGNLKKLELQQDAQFNWFIGDVNGKPAFASDGKLNFDDLTYWTNPAGYDVVAADTAVGEISGFDGRSVNRGGAAQQINGFLSGSPGINNSDSGARQLFTEPAAYTNGTATALATFDATAANAASWWSYLNANGVYSTGTTFNATTWSTATSYATATSAEQTEALNILKFARGIDVTDQNANGSVTDSRPWLMGDPIHARPLAINYGATTGYSVANPNIRIIVGGNDGFLHMFTNTDTSGAQYGKETWAFMPYAVMNIQERLKTNTPGSPVSPYGIDGESTVYTYDANQDGTLKATDGDKVYVYSGLRRGGRHLYALDISNPDNPKMLWHISNATPGFSELGLTFSTPTIIHISYDSNVKVPALIFAGGYDTNKDTRSDALGTNDSMGRGIFIVDATTGALIWKAVAGGATGNISTTEYDHALLLDSIPAKVTTLDSNNAGAIDRFYVGDTGGVIWRGDLAGTNRTNWKLTQFASVGRHLSGATKTQDVRYFHAVDIAQTLDSSGPYDAVAAGTGDRANPLDKAISSTNIPANWFFMFKDRNTISGSPSSSTILASDVADLSNNCFQNVGLTCTSTQTNALVYGWKIALNQATGEKDLSAPSILNGTIYFSTYLPPTTINGSTCGPSEGKSSEYAVNLQNSSAVFNYNQSNSVTDSSGQVIDIQSGDRYIYNGSGIASDVVIITKINTSTGNTDILKCSHNGSCTSIGTTKGKRTFWYQRKN